MVDMETNSTASEHEEEWKLEPGLRIVGICGSLRKNSTTKSGLTVALLGAEKFGVDTHLIELSDYELPFCGATSEEVYPADVAHLRREIQESHGVSCANC